MRECGRDAALRRHLPNFDVGDYALVPRPDYHTGENLALRWRGTRSVIKAVSDYIYKI